jgi:hypothetical protein
MEFVYVYRDENGEITGSATHAENGEKMSISNPEYVAWSNKVYPPTWEQIRSRRDQLLKETDWAALPDVNFDSKQSWLVYRNKLRNIPQKFKSPEEVVWPEKPNN